MDGVARGPGADRAVQRRHGQVVRARRRLRGDRRRADRARGPDQRRRRVERRAQRRDRDGRAPLPARRRRRHDALRRREAPRRARAGCCSSTPTCCCSTSRPTTSTPSRSSGSSASSTSTRARSSRSPTTATSSTTSPSGSSSSTAAGASRSPATTRAGWSRSSSACRASRSRPTRGSGRSPASSSGCAWARRPARRRARPGCRRTSSCSPRRTTRKETARELEIAIPPGPAARRPGHRGRGPAQGLRRPAADRGPDVLAAAVRASSGSSGPTARARRRCSGCSSARRRPTPARSTIGDTVAAELRRPEPRRARAPTRRCSRRSPRASRSIKVGTREVPARAYVSSFNFRGTDQQKLVGDAVGRRAQPRPPREAAPVRRQRPAARRADQRPRRRHAARARGRPRVVPGLRRRHQPRPLVPRPDRDPHPRVRGRQPGPLLPGQRQRLRGVPPQGARHGRRPAAPDPVQAARGLTGRATAREGGSTWTVSDLAVRRGVRLAASDGAARHTDRGPEVPMLRSWTCRRTAGNRAVTELLAPATGDVAGAARNDRRVADCRRPPTRPRRPTRTMSIPELKLSVPIQSIQMAAQRAGRGGTGNSSRSRPRQARSSVTFWRRQPRSAAVRRRRTGSTVRRRHDHARGVDPDAARRRDLERAA